MAKRDFFTFGTLSRFDTRYNLPGGTPSQCDTVAIEEISADSTPFEQMLWFVDAENPEADRGEWLCGHQMVMYEGGVASGTVTSSFLTVNATKDLGVQECGAADGEKGIGVLSNLWGSGVPDEDDVIACCVSGTWKGIIQSGTSTVAEEVEVSSDAGQLEDGGPTIGTVGQWAESTTTYVFFHVNGYEKN